MTSPVPRRPTLSALAAFVTALVLLPLPDCAALPSHLTSCEAWTEGSAYPAAAMHGVTGIVNASELQCRIRGLPPTYYGGARYTIAVISDYIVGRKLFASGGLITASSRAGPRPLPTEMVGCHAVLVLLYSSGFALMFSRRIGAYLTTVYGMAQGGDLSPLCFSDDRAAHGAVLFDWTAPLVPSTGSATTVTFAALCGGSSVGLGGAGFVAASAHVMTFSNAEAKPAAHDAGHIHLRVDTTALEEFTLSGRTAASEADDHHAMDHGDMEHEVTDHDGMDYDHDAMDSSTMDHSTMDHGTMDHGSAHGMFFTRFNPTAPSLTILFSGWDITTSAGYAGSVICFFCLGVLVRMLRLSLSMVRRRATVLPLISQAAVFFVINTLAYLLMLAAMTYDVGIFFAIVVGMTVGFWIELVIAKRQAACGDSQVDSDDTRSSSHKYLLGEVVTTGPEGMGEGDDQLIAVAKPPGGRGVLLPSVDCCTTEIV